MKKITLLLSILMMACIARAQTSAESYNLATSVTNIAGSTSNTTPGPAKYLAKGSSPIRIWLSCNGNQAVSTTGMTVKFATASGTGTGVTNNFDSAATSYIKLTITNALTSTTSTISDWFNIDGVKYLRVASIENGYSGAVSNIVINVGYPTNIP